MVLPTKIRIFAYNFINLLRRGYIALSNVVYNSIYIFVIFFILNKISTSVTFLPAWNFLKAL